MGVRHGGEELHWRHWGLLALNEVEELGNVLSSIYQLQGNSTSVFSVGVAGAGSGFIQVDADK